RYILEDIPTGMVPFVAVGKLLGMPVKKMQLVIDLCEGMLDEDLTNCDSARNLEKLGLAGMTAEQIVEYAKTGIK
ncbi:MAG: NAD/NADP octopine/nopaline dehydrogenase family protein, partial [Anaerovoracaceae bacterium]